MNPFWWAWPSLAVEIPVGAGLMLYLHAWGPRHAVWLYWLVGLAISLVYERWLDRHGWSWQDVLERLCGQLLGELAWWLAVFIYMH
jgi:hypothetical protein